MTRALLMVARGRGDATEAEPVVAELRGDELILELDDGEQLSLDVGDVLELLLDQARDDVPEVA